MLDLERRGDGVAVLRMDDGKVNAIGPAFLDRFDKAWAEAAAAGGALVLAGNAKAFSAGLDLKALPAMDRAELARYVRRFVRAFAAVYGHQGPVVAAVDGPAMAGGAILALCAEVRLASPAARMGLTEMPVGIPFPPPVLALVREALPAHELGPAVFQGQVREGEACVPAGWAHRVVPRETLLGEAVAAAAQLARHSPRAYAMAKQGLRRGVAEAMLSWPEAEAEAYVAALASPDTIAHITRYFAGLAAARAPRGAVGSATPKG